jgi:hypothetical protein
LPPLRLPGAGQDLSRRRALAFADVINMLLQPRTTLSPIRSAIVDRGRARLYPIG